MKYIALLLIFGFGLSGFGQTIKSLGFNSTNGQVVANTGTNVLTFSNNVAFNQINLTTIAGTNTEAAIVVNQEEISISLPLFFSVGASTTRANLGLSLSALTNTSVTNFKTALDLGSFRSPDGYAALYWGDVEILNVEDGVNVHYPIYWSGINGDANAAQTRINLGLGWSALTNTNTATSLLGFTTNGQVVANTGTNVLTFTNLVSAQALTVAIGTNQYIYADDSVAEFFVPIAMESSQGISFTTNAAAATRTNLGIGLPALTNTSNANFRTAIGVAPVPIFKTLTNDFSITNQTNMTVVDELTVNTEANKRYIVKLFPILSASVSSMPLQIVASNATVYGFWDAQSTLGFSTNVITNAFGSSVTAQRALLQTFHVVAGTNNGSIAFQFATIATPNTNTVHAGSYMMAQEIVPTP